MDKIDEGILNELMNDPKKPFLTIAQKIQIAPVTVQARFEKLKKQGAIWGTTTIVDLSKIGFQGKAFLFASASQDYDPESTIKSLYEIPNVYLISEVMGKFDLLIIAIFHDISGIRETVRKIRDLKGIDKVEVSLNNEPLVPLKIEFTKISLFNK